MGSCRSGVTDEAVGEGLAVLNGDTLTDASGPHFSSSSSARMTVSPCAPPAPGHRWSAVSRGTRPSADWPGGNGTRPE